MTDNYPARINSIQGVIFDFNGTLFYDTDFHDAAWMEFAQKKGRLLSKEQMTNHVHGATNKETLHFIFDGNVSSDEIEKYAREKEALYRQKCLEQPDKCVLAPGAVEFLDKIKRENIPRIIATASNRENLDFFIELFHLKRWFDTALIVYDDGNHRGKPFPDLFLSAAKNLNVSPEHCMIIEDSVGGLQAAKTAGAGKIVAISKDSNDKKFEGLTFITQHITDFRQIDIGHASRGNQGTK